MLTHYTIALYNNYTHAGDPFSINTLDEYHLYNAFLFLLLRDQPEFTKIAKLWFYWLSHSTAKAEIRVHGIEVICQEYTGWQKVLKWREKKERGSVRYREE